MPDRQYQNTTSPKGRSTVSMIRRNQSITQKLINNRCRDILLVVVGLFFVSALLVPSMGPSSHAGSVLPTRIQELKVYKDAAADAQLTGPALLDAVNKHHPINRMQCGSWVDSYTKLHSSIMSGKGPQRYAIFRSKFEFGNGLADRLACSVTAFLYALLTNRAYLYDWDPPPEHDATKKYQDKHTYEPQTPLWSALRSEFIDWRYRDSPDLGNTTLLLDYNMDKGTEEFKDMWQNKDMTKVGEDVHTVIWYADRASVFNAFDNPFLKDKLAALGLEQNTAFACLFDYLYRPTKDVVELFQPELQVLLDPNALKVGLQIRVGDWQLVDSYTFKPQNYPSLFRHYFECADEIAAELAKPGQRVVYYTLADIPALRPALAARYSDHILINPAVSVEHIVKSKKQSDVGFKQACGELWAFSLTTSQVITKISGFGKVPAMVNANGTQHIFTINYPMNFFDLVSLNNRKNLALYHRRRCTRQYADPLKQVCSDFTGI